MRTRLADREGDAALEQLLRDVERIVDGFDGVSRLVIEAPVRGTVQRDE